MTDCITFRNRSYPPQDVYLNGIKVGHVEFYKDGWRAFDREGEMVRFCTHKSRAGNMLADHSRQTTPKEEDRG